MRKILFLAQIDGQDIQITGALATGIGSIAFGGQRYDKAGADFSEEPRTEVKGNQSFGAGGGVIVNGDWSAAFGKETRALMRAGFVTGGGSQTGITKEEYTDDAIWRLT